MTHPESTPEDQAEAHLCPRCECGIVTLCADFRAWTCDKCNFEERYD